MSTPDLKTDSMAVERLAAVPVRPKVVPILQVSQWPTEAPPTIQTPASEPAVIIQRQEVSDVLLAAFSALGFAVSARFILFLSLIGAFVLAVMAMVSQAIMAVIVLSLYAALIVLPLVWLETRSKRAE